MMKGITKILIEVLIWIILTMFIVIISAYLDSITFGKVGFIEYMKICLWEAFIASLGFILGLTYLKFRRDVLRL